MRSSPIAVIIPCLPDVAHRATGRYTESMGLRESSDRHEAVLQQLNEERAAALTRISRTLESLLDQLQAIRARAKSAGYVSSVDADEYERVRARAKEYRWWSPSALARDA